MDTISEMDPATARSCNTRSCSPKTGCAISSRTPMGARGRFSGEQSSWLLLLAGSSTSQRAAVDVQKGGSNRQKRTAPQERDVVLFTANWRQVFYSRDKSNRNCFRYAGCQVQSTQYIVNSWRLCLPSFVCPRNVIFQGTGRQEPHHDLHPSTNNVLQIRESFSDPRRCLT